MKIVVFKEQDPQEKRVAVTPETVSKMCQKGWRVHVESGAGLGAHISDADFKKGGAHIEKDHKALYQDADAALSIGAPSATHASHFPQGIFLIGMMGNIAQNTLTLLKKCEASVFCLQRLPRISRAQSMDVLSSQSTVAGYAAMILAARSASCLFPLLMTAGGTLPPLRVLVLGAGVAGLQAIATAQRLGARVLAYDVRPEVGEQVKSLGADFLDIPMNLGESAQEGGYAKGLSDKAQDLQRQALKEVMHSMDVVVTTALVMGKKAPLLLTRDMVDALQSGSVIVDMAAPMGGNCELTQPGKTIVHQDVTIEGPMNLASHYAKDASALYARNALSFLNALWNEAGQLREDIDQELVRPTCLLGDLLPFSSEERSEQVQERTAKAAPKT